MAPALTEAAKAYPGAPPTGTRSIPRRLPSSWSSAVKPTHSMTPSSASERLSQTPPCCIRSNSLETRNSSSATGGCARACSASSVTCDQKEARSSTKTSASSRTYRRRCPRSAATAQQARIPPRVAGHAAYGNLHFTLTPILSEEADKERYGAFMSDLVDLVIGKYDGSLKAEHGTGRNMAPSSNTNGAPKQPTSCGD